MPVERSELKPGVELVHDSTPYPQDVMVIIDTSEGLRASPLGGGFVYLISDSMLAVSHIATDAEKAGPKWEQEYFQIEDGPVFHGWHTNHRWNGWHMPFFELDVAEQVCKAFGFDWWRYHQPDDAFYTWSEDSGDWPDMWDTRTVMVDGQPVKLYGIGAGSFIWSDAMVWCSRCDGYIQLDKCWDTSYEDLAHEKCTDTPNRGPMSVEAVKERMGWG